MRSVLYLAVVGSLAMLGCDDDPGTPIDAGFKDAPIDAPPPPWWQPKPGAAKDYDIQLTAPINTSLPRTMYVLDLFDLVPAPTMLDYGDGSPLTIPAGSLATTLASLHARRPRTIVICHVGTGGIDLDDPDASKFPGFAASPPDDPTPPAVDSVVGWSVNGIANTRFLDIRPAARAVVLPLIAKRFELAKTIGCDGVTGIHNDQRASTGFSTLADPDLGPNLASWGLALAPEAHSRELSIGMRDGYDITGLADQFAVDYDWMLAPRCGEFGGCGDYTRPFIIVEKAVLALDYDTDVFGNPYNPSVACGAQHEAGVFDGIVKDVPLSSAFRANCNVDP